MASRTAPPVSSAASPPGSVVAGGGGGVSCQGQSLRNLNVNDVRSETLMQLSHVEVTEHF